MGASMSSAMARTGAALLLCAGLALAGGDPTPRIVRLTAEPATLELHGAGADHGLLVSAETEDGRSVDVTREAAYTCSNSKIVEVAAGRVRAVSDGEATISVAYANQTATIKAVAADVAVAVPPSFRNEVVPVLTRYGCNQGGCHGKE